MDLQQLFVLQKQFPTITAVQIRTNSDIPRDMTPISLYPVPDMSTLDEDLQERFKAVEEKVRI